MNPLTRRLSGTVTLEGDDVTLVADYEYTRPQRATRWEPAEGGIVIEYVTAILEGANGPVPVPVADFYKLRRYDELLELAAREVRELEAA